MATSPETNPPLPSKGDPKAPEGKSAATPPGAKIEAPAKSAPQSKSDAKGKADSLGKDARSLSALSENDLTKSILRRGLATPQEIDACKAHRAKLAKGRIFDEKTALKIVLAVAEALKHAHHRGLIHRDIKPENVILTRDGNVKLADLGLARLTADEKWAMAEAGMAIGTPYYISPEQVRGQVDVDIRADVYGLGATLYHMVTGRVPYAGDSPSEVMNKHADKNPTLAP